METLHIIKWLQKYIKAGGREATGMDIDKFAEMYFKKFADGGRANFFKGAVAGGGNISPGTSTTGSVRDDNPFTGGDGAKGPPQTIPKEKPKETYFQKFKRTFNPFPIATNLIDRISKSKLARINNAIQRQNYIDSLDLNNPKEKEEYDRIMNQLSGLGMDIIAGPKDLESTMLSAPPSMLAKDPMTQFKTVDGVSTLADEGVKDVLGQGYEDYLNRFETTEDRDGPQSLDPCKGPNPPAYCFIGQRADENQEAAVTRNLAGLTPRIGGGIFNFDNMADGGIADQNNFDYPSLAPAPQFLAYAPVQDFSDFDGKKLCIGGNIYSSFRGGYIYINTYNTKGVTVQQDPIEYLIRFGDNNTIDAMWRKNWNTRTSTRIF